jgi:hypothetical protein
VQRRHGFIPTTGWITHIKALLIQGFVRVTDAMSGEPRRARPSWRGWPASVKHSNERVAISVSF